MKILLPLLATALLAGCYNPRYPSDDEPRQSANTVSNTYRTGYGVIEAITRPSPAAAGATNVQSTEVTIRMDDGTQQTIALPGATEFRPGDRVEVTRDPYVLRR